jgi:aerobic-type carbon monoxide dehydrogenase small subunit (CoxS/CutS family)
LRENIGLTGAHVGCVIGECGACSILLDGKVVKSCLHLAVQADSREVTTVEGLAKNGELNPVQEAFVKNYAFQCGYCTPGLVITSQFSPCCPPSFYRIVKIPARRRVAQLPSAGSPN